MDDIEEGKIGKKEELKYSKHNKKLYYYYYPDFSSPSRHIYESLIIKTEQPGKYRGTIFHAMITLALKLIIL